MDTEKKNHSAISTPNRYLLGCVPCAWMRGSSYCLQNKVATTTVLLLHPYLHTGFKVIPDTENHPLLLFTRSLLLALSSLAQNPTTTMTMMMSLPLQKVIIHSNSLYFDYFTNNSNLMLNTYIVIVIIIILF